MPLYTAATFRTVGSAAVAQNLFSIWNGSADFISLLQLTFQMDCTAVLTSVMPMIKCSLVDEAPGAGIDLEKCRYSGMRLASDPLVVAKGEASVDGGSRTALTGTPGETVWQQYGMRMHTNVGQVLGADNHLLPKESARLPLVIRKNQGIIVNVVAPTGASNPATNHYFVQALWRESRR
jgi:hypothetical protein